MAVLVTGGSGFLGRALIRQLLLDGQHVVATSKNSNNRLLAPGLQWITVELNTFTEWSPILADISHVYHLAWSTVPSTANSDPLRDASDNLIGSLRLMEAVAARSGQRIIFASSGGAVYGQLNGTPATEEQATKPIGAYGLSKLTVEHYLKLYGNLFGLDYQILRLGNAFGPGQISKNAFGIVAAICSKAIMNEPLVIFGDGRATRDYVYVDDAVDALLLAGRISSRQNVFNIGSGIGRSLIDVVAAVEKSLGRTLPRRHEPSRSFDVPMSVLDVCRAKTELGWQPKTSFEQGIGHIFEAL